MEGIAKTKETVDASDDRETTTASLSEMKSVDSNAPKAASAATAAVSKPLTNGKKVKPEKREKRPYHYRTKKPRDMPKRPLSAYNYFFRTERGKFVAEQAEKEAAGTDTFAPEAAQDEDQGGEKVKSSLFATMGKTIAKRWKEVIPEELEEYKALAARDSKRYRAEMDEYHAGRARKSPQKKEKKSSPVSKEASLSTSQPTAPSFLEGISGLSSSLPSRGGAATSQLQQTAAGHDPYLDQLLRLKLAQQGSAPQQQPYGSPNMGNINAGGGNGVDISALQSQLLDAQLSRAMQQQQQRGTLWPEMFSAATGGQYAAAQGLYGGGTHNPQAMIDEALYQRPSRGMQTPGQTAASQLQGNIAQGGGGYDSYYQGGGGGSEQQQLLLQLMQQQFGASQQQPQQYSALSAMDPQASSGDITRLMLQQQQMALQHQAGGGYSSAPNEAEDRDVSGGDSAGERW